VSILVTGASGFIGAHVAAQLAAQGAEVRGFCRSEPPPGARVADWLRGDVTDAEAVRRAVSGCDAVVHTAAIYSYARSEGSKMQAVNVEGTRNVCEAAVRAGVRRLLLTSSSATCGPVPGRAATERDSPPSWELSIPYKRTKLEAERLALSFAECGLEVVCVNPTTVVGAEDRRPTPSGKIVRDLVEGRIRAFVKGGGINVVSVEDVAIGHALALAHGRSGERYILGGEDLEMREAFSHVVSTIGRGPPRFGVPWRVPYSVALLSDRLYRLIDREPSLLVLDEVKLARHPLFFSSAKAEAELGYSPASAADALTAAARWFARAGESRSPARASWRTRSAASGSASIRSGGGGA
jgi:dihydroflavonol-4-reductase